MRKLSALVMAAEVFLIIFGVRFMLDGLLFRPQDDAGISAYGGTSEQSASWATNHEHAEDLPEFILYSAGDETAHILLPGPFDEDYYDGEYLDAVFSDDEDSAGYYFFNDGAMDAYEFVKETGDEYDGGSVCTKEHIVNYRVVYEEDPDTGGYIYHWYSYAITDSDNVFFIEMTDIENDNDMTAGTLRILWDGVSFLP